MTGCVRPRAATRIADALATLTQGRAPGELQRSVASFFQANRFLLPELVVAVMGAVLPDGEILDLYSGVGLFAAALAASGRPGVTAVEGNPASGADLRVNAAAWPSRLTVVVTAVEQHLASLRGLPPTVIVDPPRTGLSKETAEGLAKAEGVRRLVYVSCDPPTMARDARIILDGGFTLTSLHAFDLFPNTPHVEALAIFDRSDSKLTGSAASALARCRDQGVEQAVELAGAPEILRVPLHAEAERAIGRLDRFDDAVGGGCGGDQSRAEPSDGLMMAAVDAARVARRDERAHR